MFQNQINILKKDIKRHYPVFSFSTMHKFDDLLNSDNLEELLDYCKISPINDGGDPLRIIGRLEMLNALIKESKI